MSSSMRRKRKEAAASDDASEAPVKKSKRSKKKSAKDEAEVDTEMEEVKTSKPKRGKGSRGKRKAAADGKRRNMKPEESAMPPPDPNKQYPSASTQLTKKIDKAFRALANPTAAIGQSKYMRHQFHYLGLTSPTLRATLKPIVKEALASEIDEKQLFAEMRVLWSMKESEFHYAALELASAAEKMWSPAILDVFAEFVENRGWWDTVDTISGLVGRLLNKHPSLRPVVAGWIDDACMWKRRVAIIHQKAYKTKTDEALLFSLIKKTMHEDDFFIRKAIGWALREYSKANKKAVRAFIDENEASLSALSIKEGRKYC